MTEYAGSGDARASMALLWGRREPAGRGPKQRLTPDDIARAAIELADAEGLGAVSMRKVGQRLGTSAMALYTYVPAKTELLDLMLDRVLAELVLDPPGAGGWREAVRAWARAEWDFHQRHPWVVQIVTARPVLGPGDYDLFESQLRIFDGLGLAPVEVTRLASTVASFIGGAVRQVADTRAAEAAMGVPEDEWWAERSGLLEEMTEGLDWEGRWPTVTRLEAEGAFAQADRDPDDDTGYLERDALDAFQFGLERLLDGIEVLVAERQAGA